MVRIVRVTPTVVTLVFVLGSVMYLSHGKGGGVAGEKIQYFDLANRHLKHRVYLSLVLCNVSVIVILSMKNSSHNLQPMLCYHNYW